MLFSSIPFLYYFLPVVMILYFLAPQKVKNGFLLIASLIFYGIGEPKYLILIVTAILSGYVFGILIGKYKERPVGRLFLFLSVAVPLGMLLWFKYADFAISGINGVFGLSIPLLRIALPIGISFYTFQILSYNVDVYRGDVEPERNIINFAAFVSLFPQLIAGPIVRYSEVAPDLRKRSIDGAQVYKGLVRFLTGLGKKVLVANPLFQLCEIFRAAAEPSVLFYWIYAVAFALYVYFDFSGYSDMAIGLGKMMGFKFPENFNYPFLSKSATEFWRRWHMTLGRWFRDYVYIPMGGNRRSRPRWLFNILTVWVLTGLWHGAAWNFAVWGLFFAVVLAVEKLWILKPLEKSRVISRVYAFLFITVSFVIFNANSMGQAGQDLSAMFGFSNLPFVTEETLYYLKSYAIALAIGIFGSMPVMKMLLNRIKKHDKGEKVIRVLTPVFCIAVLILSTAWLVDGSFNPFLYFRF